ncbi:hypothetical protein VTJ83DRAFT_3121 [Remersonia thermophila]|uniref:Uncharacterized protein n=1 Tax=Remersonia thermophila TaxID=72144 RepID=A0ABR4DDT4_9PEZI
MSPQEENSLNILPSMGQAHLCNLRRVPQAQIDLNQLVRMKESRKAFLSVLARAETAMDPFEWISDYRCAYNNAVANGVNEAAGIPAITAFLDAVLKRIAPAWAYKKHIDLADDIVRNIPPKGVEVYVEQLNRFLLLTGSNARISPQGHATFGGRGQSSDPQDPLRQGFDKKNGGGGKAKPSGSGGGSGRGKKGNGGRKGGDRGYNQSNDQNGKTNRKPKVHQDCPCGTIERHYWTPIKCLNLRAAITGKNERGGLVPQVPRQFILDQLQKPQWADLRAELQAQGMSLPGPGALQPGPASGRSYPAIIGVAAKADNDKYPPGSVDAAVVSHDLRTTLRLPPGVHDTFQTDRHPLHNSIVLNSGSAVHIVNDKSRFEPGSWREVDDPNDCVEAGASSFQVQARGRWRLKNVLNGNRGPNTEDLILEDVAFIDGFHVNIVSEVSLRQADLWYCGWDRTLRYGPLDHSLVLRQLVYKHNQVFF